tara:strand:+ start:138 stop:1175 length:1038 start_codon:yes stop_codon:yes gene_type:complete
MNEIFPDIKTTVLRLITDKPVRKTPYQVKGVFIKKHPSEPITPMLDGTYRKKFSYPRVQVKILNEQIYIIGIKEGVEPVLSIPDKIKELDFGNITFTIKDFEEETLKQQFALSSTVVKYSFLTSWAALNLVTGKKYRSIPFKKKNSYLNKLLGVNLIFLAKEMGVPIDKGVYTKLEIPNLHPKSIDDNKWKSFKGDFKTNIILPNYIGLGNGITRGYGTISGLFDINKVVFDKELGKEEIKDMDLVLPEDLIKKKKKTKDKKSIENRFKKEKSFKNAKKQRNKHSLGSKKTYYKKNRNHTKSKRIFSEDFDVVVDGNIITPEKESDVQDDQRFNTERHHKQQHKF